MERKHVGNTAGNRIAINYSHIGTINTGNGLSVKHAHDVIPNHIIFVSPTKK